jgi:glycosyltransferase involved in cell wall biosynthesis
LLNREGLVVSGQLFLTGRRRRGAFAVTYVTNQLPYPAHSGGQLREAQLLTRAGTTVDVDLFVLTEHYERDARHAHLATAHCRSVRLFESMPTPGDGPAGDVPERVWRYDSADFDASIREHLAAFPPDVVHVEGYFLAEHLPTDLPIPVVIVAENVEYLIDRDNEIQGRARGAPWPVSKKREYAALSRSALVGAVCREDAEILLADAPQLSVSVFPNGADHLGLGHEEKSERGAPSDQVTFIGNYSWGPTLDGAWSLVREIWPCLLKTHPTARLALVGAGIPSDLRLAAEAVRGIQVVGEVESVLPVLADTDIFVCPLWIRSGIKVKMLEALSAGCTVVCTTAALRGLPTEVERAVVTANDYQSFAEAIGTLMDDPARRHYLSKMARHAIETFPTWDDAAEILVQGWRQASAGQEIDKSGGGAVAGAESQRELDRG